MMWQQGLSGAMRNIKNKQILTFQTLAAWPQEGRRYKKNGGTQDQQNDQLTAQGTLTTNIKISVADPKYHSDPEGFCYVELGPGTVFSLSQYACSERKNNFLKQIILKKLNQ